MEIAKIKPELFPALILALTLVLAAEQLLANRFYEGTSATAVEVLLKKPNARPKTPALNAAS